MLRYFTEETDFYGENTPQTLLSRFGSPLYVYNERILRSRARDMAGLIDYPLFHADYSVKANTNLEILKILREEGLHADAMSAGEIFLLREAGYSCDEILFVGNNLSRDELAFAHDSGVMVSMDSLDQLADYAEMFPGSEVALRINTGHGAGHHEFVITAGKKTKFGINEDSLDMVDEICARHSLKVIGLNQHVGSLFMDESAYVSGACSLTKTAMRYPDLKFVDFGGGFGIPYHKQDGEAPLDIIRAGERLSWITESFMRQYGREIAVRTEPGRYVVAECGVLLGTVNAIKDNAQTTYVGTDIGFNIMQRVVMYSSHHDMEAYRNGTLLKGDEKPVTVVGNICESGDKLAQDRPMPQLQKDDIIGVMDAGAYGYSMASTYNSRQLPAEVLIGLDGHARLIRRRSTLKDLLSLSVEH